MIVGELRTTNTAGDILAHIKAGLVLAGRDWDGGYEWIGHRDKFKAVPVHLKVIKKNWDLKTGF